MSWSRQDKIRMYRELTAGAQDCFAARVKTAREGEERWRPVYFPLSDEMIARHLGGLVELGSYPLIPTGDPWPNVRWICADFDGKKTATRWKEDVRRTVEFMSDFDGCPCFVNLSRSAQGAHVRMLFKEPVPAWMARRWMNWWLEEAGVLDDTGSDYLQPSFDRLLPPQDQLPGERTDRGDRSPGNLAGSPLNGRLAKINGGTLPLATARVLSGNFEPDGEHWQHVSDALEGRSWGTEELRRAMLDVDLSIEPPRIRLMSSREVANGLPYEAWFATAFCEFMIAMANGHQNYDLWVAMATQLQRFGEAGREAFHRLSATDGRYKPRDTDRKWNQTRGMRPVRCETLASAGYTCPHLNTKRCGGCRAPSYLALNSHVEPLDT